MNHWIKFIAVWACAATTLALVADIPTPIRLLKGEPYERISLSVALHLHRNATTLFVDARPAPLFAQGHIESAISITEITLSDSEMIRRIKAAPNVVLYGGRDRAESYRALKALSAMRIYGLKYYENGWPEWSLLQLPITKPSA